MQGVIISVRPQWTEKMAAGEKLGEVRKNAPKIKPPFRCYVYETQGPTDTPWVDEDGHTIFRGRGQVIGEFICDSVETINFFADWERPERENIIRRFVERSCVPEAELVVYAGGKAIYLWNIKDFRLYDRPMELSEFRKPCIMPECPYCPGCEVGYEYVSETEAEFLRVDGECSTEWVCLNFIKRPPQSWCYCEEVTV